MKANTSKSGSFSFLVEDSLSNYDFGCTIKINLEYIMRKKKFAFEMMLELYWKTYANQVTAGESNQNIVLRLISRVTKSGWRLKR